MKGLLAFHMKIRGLLSKETDPWNPAQAGSIDILAN